MKMRRTFSRIIPVIDNSSINQKKHLESLNVLTKKSDNIDNFDNIGYQKGSEPIQLCNKHLEVKYDLYLYFIKNKKHDQQGNFKIFEIPMQLLLTFD